MPPYWLMKSEPGECSIDGALVAPEATVGWIGVRSYQARNFMRDQMQPGDGVLFYHSSGAQPGIAGVARVARVARVASGTRPCPTRNSTWLHLILMPPARPRPRAGCCWPERQAEPVPIYSVG